MPSSPRSRWLSLVGLFLAVVCGCLPAGLRAQSAREGANQGKVSASSTVADITIEYGDVRSVSEEAIFARILLRPGMSYSQNLVDRSIRSLYETRQFDTITTRTEDLGEGRVRIVFIVQARYRIESLSFEGNKKVKSRRLRKECQTEPGLALDERQIRKDIDAMLKYYREKGYTYAKVDYRAVRNPDNGTAKVTYVVDEGLKIRIKRVDFEGSTAFTPRQLRKEMQVRRWWIFSWLTGSGRFDEVKLQEDLDKLRTKFMNAGYLDVSIPESGVSLDYPEKPTRMVITIRIDEGRRYYCGEISFEGNKLFDLPTLYGSLNLLPGDVFSPEILDKDVERLTNLYGSLGYLDVSVKPERKPNLETGAIDLNYMIVEGERFDLESINIEGNTKTKSIVVLRELALQPGRNFNLVFMKNSESRLKNTRFFDEVQLSPEETRIPGRRNLKATVKEGRTGNFQFGAGFSTLESVTFFFEISQSNFDLFRWRTPFLQGDGQKFRFRTSIGSRSRQVTVNFEEPWLFEQRLAWGVELYRTETDYNGVYYDEVRTGISTYLRKRLIGLIDGQLTYTYEVVELNDVSFNAPLLIQQESLISPRNTSKVDLSVIRDTRNDLIFTTRGSRVQLASTFAGLGGDTEYMKFEARSASYLPTFEFGEQVLSILARAGSFWAFADPTNGLEWNEGAVPFYDRFFLGGPNTLRGFEYREVGPMDNQEPIGGNSYGFGSMEYSIKVAEPLRIAAFYDWGFVNSRDFDFDPRGYNDNWGFGIRLLILGNPLRLDYGLPITSTRYPDGYDNNQGGQFNFSFGTRF